MVSRQLILSPMPDLYNIHTEQPYSLQYNMIETKYIFEFRYLLSDSLKKLKFINFTFIEVLLFTFFQAENTSQQTNLFKTFSYLNQIYYKIILKAFEMKHLQSLNDLLLLLIMVLILCNIPFPILLLFTL